MTRKISLSNTDFSLSCCVCVQKLRPRGLELQQGELGDLVEQEMAATSAAVESAAARIEVRVSVWVLLRSFRHFFLPNMSA